MSPCSWLAPFVNTRELTNRRALPLKEQSESGDARRTGEAIQELAGHPDHETTQRFMDLSPAALDRLLWVPPECPGIHHICGGILEAPATAARSCCPSRTAHDSILGRRTDAGYHRISAPTSG